MKLQHTMRGAFVVFILVFSALIPSTVVSEEVLFKKSFFDQNSDGIDDRMNHLLVNGDDVSVIVILEYKPNEQHISQIKDIGLKIDHIYKYINAIRIDNVPYDKIDDLTKVSDLKLIEWQAPVYPMLDTAVKAIKVRNSEEYSPVVWDKGLYGEGINVAVLDTGVDNEHETFGIYEDQGVRRFIAGMNCDGGCPTDDQGNYEFTTEEDSNEDPDDFDGHGTHVASTVLGTGGDDDESEGKDGGTGGGASSAGANGGSAGSSGRNVDGSNGTGGPAGNAIIFF